MAITKTHLRFKQIREHLGLGQIAFAEKAGIKQAQVSQIETGARDISDIIYQQLEENLKVNRNWLANGEGDMFTEATAQVVSDKEPRIKRNGALTVRSVDMEVQGQRLEFFRKLIQISVDQLATELGVESATYYRYKGGKIDIPTRAVVYLHRQYQLNYNWFFECIGNPKDNGAGETVRVDTDNLVENINILGAKIAYLEKQQKIEKEARKKLQRDLNELTVKY